MKKKEFIFFVAVMFSCVLSTACTKTSNINHQDSPNHILSLSSTTTVDSKKSSLPEEIIKPNPKTHWVKNSVKSSDIQKQNLESRFLSPKTDDQPNVEALDAPHYNAANTGGTRRGVAEARHSGTQPKSFSLGRPKVSDHQQTPNAP